MLKNIKYLMMLLFACSQAAFAYSVLPNGEVTDGEVLNPKVVAKQDSYANAPAYAKSLCRLSQFRCVRINQHNAWKQLFPDENRRLIEQRLNRTNIPLKYRSWLVELRSWRNVSYMSLSPFAAHLDTGGRKLVLIDLKLYAFGAYNKKGDLVYWGPAASGRAWCSENEQSCQTQAGSFRIYRKKGAQCQSGTYPIETHGGAPMPYCMYFYRGFAMHGSTLSGFNNRSRGCIRLFYDDALWLNQVFVRVGTRVVVR